MADTVADILVDRLIDWGVAADVKFVQGDRQWFVGPRITW